MQPLPALPLRHGSLHAQERPWAARVSILELVKTSGNRSFRFARLNFDNGFISILC